MREMKEKLKLCKWCRFKVMKGMYLEFNRIASASIRAKAAPQGWDNIDLLPSNEECEI